MAVTSYFIKAEDFSKAALGEHLMQVLRDAPSSKLSLHSSDPEIWELESPAKIASVVEKHIAFSEPVFGEGDVEDVNFSDTDGGIHNGNDHLSTIRASVPAAPTRPSLLTIPPEMRNRIYRCALVQPEPIQLRPANRWPESPPLLQTCHQIRSESSGIYYQENTFEVHIHKYDAAKYIKWSLSSPHRDGSNHTLEVSSSYNWANLEYWAEAYWRRRCHAVSPARQEACTQVHEHVFALLERMAAHDPGMSWEVVRPMLGDVRKALAVKNKKWRV